MCPRFITAFPLLFYKNPPSHFLFISISHIYAQFWRIQLPRSSQIANPAPFSSEISDLENTHSDPVHWRQKHATKKLSENAIQLESINIHILKFATLTIHHFCSPLSHPLHSFSIFNTPFSLLYTSYTSF